MRLYPMLLLAGLKLILVSGEKRLDVSVLGTTLGPGYSRQGEKAFTECPITHPYAFNFGSHCTKINTHINVSYSLPSHCGLGDLTWGTPTDCMFPTLMAPCPHGTESCNDFEYPPEPGQCTLLHPYAIAYGAFCSGNADKLNDLALGSECDGFPVTFDTPEVCVSSAERAPCSGGVLDFCVNSEINSYTGCYQDFTERVLPFGNTVFLTTNGREACVAHCLNLGHAYAGMQNGKDCWCGPSIPAVQKPESDCQTPCTGDPNEICGGWWHFTVHATGL